MSELQPSAKDANQSSVIKRKAKSPLRHESCIATSASTRLKRSMISTSYRPCHRTSPQNGLAKLESTRRTSASRIARNRRESWVRQNGIYCDSGVQSRAASKEMKTPYDRR